MHDIPGKVLWILVTFAILIEFLSITSTESTMLDKRALYIDICDFVDGVVDSRQITQAELKAFEAKIASYGFSVDYEIRHLVRQDTPDPFAAPGSPGYITTWVEVDNTTTYMQGDKIIVHVWSLGNTRSQNVLTALSAMWVKPFDETVPARIR